MKDDLIALLEAVRLVRAQLNAHKRQPSAQATLARITAIMEQPHVLRAIGHLDPPAETPSIAPSLPDTTRVN
jgi:hypothetical protein